MKKMIVCVILAFAGVVRGNAQIIGQIEQELQQLAAYEVYLKDAEKGYSIVENGIHTVGEIKNGTFNLHSAFFSSLQAINPSVKSDAEVAEIVLLQISIVESFQQAIQYFKQSGQLHSDEMSYIGNVYSTVVNDGLEDVNALLSLTTAGNYSMNDGERLEQIDALYKDMSDKYTFTQAFVGQGSSLDRSRAAELNDMGEVSALYGIK
jgi:hypothetical protein